jgi:hypothetical protein
MSLTLGQGDCSYRPHRSYIPKGQGNKQALLIVNAFVLTERYTACPILGERLVLVWDTSAVAKMPLMLKCECGDTCCCSILEVSRTVSLLVQF